MGAAACCLREEGRVGDAVDEEEVGDEREVQSVRAIFTAVWCEGGAEVRRK